jgi:hypothetical protein
METKQKVMENWVFAVFQQSLNLTGKVILIHTVKANRDSGGTTTLILKPGTRRKWAVSPMPWPIYYQEKNRQGPINKKLVGTRDSLGNYENG